MDGIFSACVSMFAAGCLIHFITFPKLETSFTVPNSAAKGQPFPVTIHARNQSVLPAPISVLICESGSEDAGFSEKPEARIFQRSSRHPRGIKFLLQVKRKI